MGGEEPKRAKKHICVGLLAHVDAGKTTLSEAMLYHSGSIRKKGRVDNGDAFLDTYALERQRGITIFSKQALFWLGDMQVTLLDTPGHVDFSAEMERTLQVMDYAVLVVNGADGVQGHTQTLWRLLKKYGLPVFLFVNKMDQPGTDKEALLAKLKERLDGECVDFSEEGTEGFYEEVATADERALEIFLETGKVGEEEIRRLIYGREIFPCFFGSALKSIGVEEFLQALYRLVQLPVYGEDFAAKVFKISRDPQGNRLTFLKVTGGCLRTRMVLEGSGSKGGEGWEEKVSQIRIYSGEKYRTVEEAGGGEVCAVTGLTKTYAGEGLGAEEGVFQPVLEPVMNYRLVLPEGCDAALFLPKLRQLEEEEPQFHIAWDEGAKEIQAKIMGEVQTEVLGEMIKERFGVEVGFGTGNIVYKETIVGWAEGVGHFEPLRHYAEVHLLLEAGESGSGLTFGTVCSEDELDRNWQRLILSHLEEKEHKGVLAGAPITDMKITLAAGRAHQKHTEGGDFRQAAYRALRQGLMEAESVLLEPYYDFRLEVPGNVVGRAMADMEKRSAVFGLSGTEGAMAVLSGTVPVAAVQGYHREVVAYTKGEGRLMCTFRGYGPCHNAEEVVERIGYEPERDVENPAGSVFCAHGAGFLVEWDRVKEYMHVESVLPKRWDGEDGGGYGNYVESGNRGGDESDAESRNREGDGIDAGGRNGREYGIVDGPEGQGKGFAGGAYRGGMGANGEMGGFHGSSGRTRRKSKAETGQEADVWMGAEEVDAILERTFYANRRSKNTAGKGMSGRTRREQGHEAAAAVTQDYRKPERQEEYLLVDGYNIIYAWKGLREIAEVNMDGARGKLMDILCNYQGARGIKLIVVFDAYRIPGHDTEILDYYNIHVVYTKEAETADQYIEKFAHENGRRAKVTVATSDGMEQIIIRGQGCALLSARELEEEVKRVGEELYRGYADKQSGVGNYLFDSLTEETARQLGEMKKGTE